MDYSDWVKELTIDTPINTGTDIGLLSRNLFVLRIPTGGYDRDIFDWLDNHPDIEAIGQCCDWRGYIYSLRPNMHHDPIFKDGRMKVFIRSQPQSQGITYLYTLDESLGDQGYIVHRPIKFTDIPCMDLNKIHNHTIDHQSQLRMNNSGDEDIDIYFQ